MMSRFLTLAFILWLPVWYGSTASAATYYVSPTGSSGNSGALNSPWDRASVAATGNPKGIVCGDVIVLRGGTYDAPVRWYGSYSCASLQNRVIFQNYCDEHVIFDNSTFTILAGATSPSPDITTDTTSSWMWFRRQPGCGGSFRLINSNSKTNFTDDEWGPPDPQCYPSCRPGGVQDLGDFHRFTGLWFINLGQGIASQASACGSEYYDNWFVNTGYESTERGSAAGEHTYIQNQDPSTCSSRKKFIGNFMNGSFDHAFQAQGSSGSFVRNIDIQYNVSIQPSHLSFDSEGSCFLIGGIGTADVRDNTIVFNTCVNKYAGFTRMDALRWYTSGGSTACSNCTVSNNYIATVSGDTLSLAVTLPSLTETGNRFVGTIPDTTATSQFPNSTFVTTETATIVREYWGTFDTTRGLLAIINGPNNSIVNYTPTCASGGSVELREAMNFVDGAVLHTFPCDGQPHAVTMAYAGAIMQPTNYSRIAEHTGTTARFFTLTYTGTSTGGAGAGGSMTVGGAATVK